MVNDKQIQINGKNERKDFPIIARNWPDEIF